MNGFHKEITAKEIKKIYTLVIGLYKSHDLSFI